MPSNLASFYYLNRWLISRGRWAPLIWGGALGIFCALIVAIWPSIEASIGQALTNYPQTLKEAFSISDISSAAQYLDVEMMSLIVPWALVFFAVRTAARPLVQAESDGQLDALLSLPLDRRILAVASFTATAVLTLATLLVIWFITWLASIIFAVELNLTDWTLGVINVWPLSLAFAGIAILCSGIWHSPGLVLGVSIAALLASYIIDLLGKIADSVEPYRFLALYRYYGSVIQEGFSYGNALLLLLIGLLLALIGALLFQRRDILGN